MDKLVIKKSQSNPLRPLGVFFRRFHLLIFFVFIVACLATAVLLINKTLTETSDQQLTSSINSGTIDQVTLERIQSLHTSNEAATPVQLPQGRINPFSE